MDKVGEVFCRNLGGGIGHRLSLLIVSLVSSAKNAEEINDLAYD